MILCSDPRINSCHNAKIFLHHLDGVDDELSMEIKDWKQTGIETPSAGNDFAEIAEMAAEANGRIPAGSAMQEIARVSE